MRRVENKKVTISKGIENYADLLMLCVNQTPQGGYDMAEMRKRIRAMDVIGEGGESLEFEDADFACVKACVASMRWGVAHKEILYFVEYITNEGDKQGDA